MATQHDQALCIRQWDFSETSQTVSLFGRTLGCLRGLAKGARRERGSFSGGIDVLTRGEVGVILKRDNELATLTEWDAQEIFPRLRENLEANRAAWYAADMIGRLLMPLDPHPALFDATIALLRALGKGAPMEWCMLQFQWMLLAETGWQPDLTDPGGASGTVAFDPVEGRMVPDVGEAGAWRVRRATLEALRHAEQGAETDFGDVDAMQRANKLLAAHLRNVLGEEPATMVWTFGRLPAAGPAPVRRGRS